MASVAFTLVLVLVWGLLGCTQASAPVATSASKYRPALVSRRSETYELIAEVKRNGSDCVLSARVIPLAPFHANLDYPTQLELRGTSPTSGTTSWRATALTETLVSFDIPFSALRSAGSSSSAVVRFATCTEDECRPAAERFLIPSQRFAGCGRLTRPLTAAPCSPRPHSPCRAAATHRARDSVR